MAGATSSAVHALDVTDRRGNAHQFVLRRYVRTDWLAREPDLAEREAETLVILEASTLPTPILVGADVRGEHTDVPAVLMTRLAGAPVPSADLSPVELRLLARALPDLHATSLPDGVRIRPYRPYDLEEEIGVPPWSGDDGLWRRAIGIHQSGTWPTGESFIHRDYHPGNVLFRREPGLGSGVVGQLTGVVDWANASRGAPDVDVGHCRFNLVGPAGRHAADSFRDAWLQASGRDGYDPTFDVLAVVGALRVWPSVLIGTETEVERFVAAALAEIGA